MPPADERERVVDRSPLKKEEKYRTRILLIRHGESLANAIGVFLGHTDLGLSELGKQQARETADLLRDEPISAIYTSDLLRAYETAIPIAESHGLEIHPSKQLREIHIGEWENMKITDVARIWGETFTVGWKKEFGNFTPPGGECVATAACRFYDEVMSIVERHKGECIVITAHAAVIRVFYAKVLGVPADKVVERVPFPDNASITTVYFDEEEGKLVGGEFSHACHISC